MFHSIGLVGRYEYIWTNLLIPDPFIFHRFLIKSDPNTQNTASFILNPSVPYVFRISDRASKWVLFSWRNNTNNNNNHAFSAWGTKRYIQYIRIVNFCRGIKRCSLVCNKTSAICFTVFIHTGLWFLLSLNPISLMFSFITRLVRKKLVLRANGQNDVHITFSCFERYILFF